jgi:hypothetical protein
MTQQIGQDHTKDTRQEIDTINRLQLAICRIEIRKYISQVLLPTKRRATVSAVKVQSTLEIRSNSIAIEI